MIIFAVHEASLKNQSAKKKKKKKKNCLRRIRISEPGYVCKPYLRGPFEKFVDWRQCTAVMQRMAVTVMPSCSDEGNLVVA